MHITIHYNPFYDTYIIRMHSPFVKAMINLFTIPAI